MKNIFCAIRPELIFFFLSLLRKNSQRLMATKKLANDTILSKINLSNVANLKYKKRKLFQKLGAKTSASAIHKAHLLGLI